MSTTTVAAGAAAQAGTRRIRVLLAKPGNGQSGY